MALICNSSISVSPSIFHFQSFVHHTTNKTNQNNKKENVSNQNQKCCTTMVTVLCGLLKFVIYVEFFFFFFRLFIVTPFFFYMGSHQLSSFKSFFSFQFVFFYFVFQQRNLLRQPIKPKTPVSLALLHDWKRLRYVVLL